MIAIRVNKVIEKFDEDLLDKASKFSVEKFSLKFDEYLLKLEKQEERYQQMVNKRIDKL